MKRFILASLSVIALAAAAPIAQAAENNPADVASSSLIGRHAEEFREGLGNKGLTNETELTGRHLEEFRRVMDR